MTRFATFARALAPGTLGATWRAAWLLYAGLLLIAGLVLGGNGVPPADIVGGLRASPVARTGVWMVWLAISLPVARASIAVPTTYWMRSLPVPRAYFVVVHGAVLFACVELPLVALSVAGGGALAGLAAGAGAMAAHALLVARPRRALELAALLLLGVTLVLGGGSDALLLLAALPAARVGLDAAVARAPELAHAQRRARVFGGAGLALATAHLATIVRRERGALIRGGLLALVGGAAAALGVRNNGLAHDGLAWRVLLGVGGATLPPAIAGVAVAVWRTERRHRWLLDATGTSGATRVGAAAGLAVAWGALAGAAQAGLTAALVAAAPATAAVAIVTHAAWGAGLAAVLAAAVRRVARDDRQDGERIYATVIGFTIAAATLVALVGAPLVVFVGGLGGGLLAAQAARALVAPELPPVPVEELT